MVDSRAKGGRGEYLVRDMLRAATGLTFERVPASGALSYMKGDLFVPNADNVFCIEVKNYEESHFNDKMFTNKNNHIVKWWKKIVDQATTSNKMPLLFFKYNRSKIFVVTSEMPKNNNKYVHIAWLGCYTMLAEEWLATEDIKWLKTS